MRVKITRLQSLLHYAAAMAMVGVESGLPARNPRQSHNGRADFSAGRVSRLQFLGIARRVFFLVLNTGVQLLLGPDIATFTVADPQNWVALFAFLATAILAGELSDRARRETANAIQRRRDVERHYAFSQRLLATDNVSELLNAIPGYLCQIFAGLILQPCRWLRGKSIAPIRWWMNPVTTT